MKLGDPGEDVCQRCRNDAARERKVGILQLRLLQQWTEPTVWPEYFHSVDFGGHSRRRLLEGFGEVQETYCTRSIRQDDIGYLIELMRARARRAI